MEKRYIYYWVIDLPAVAWQFDKRLTNMDLSFSFFVVFQIFSVGTLLTWLLNDPKATKESTGNFVPNVFKAICQIRSYLEIVGSLECNLSNFLSK